MLRSAPCIVLIAAAAWPALAGAAPAKIVPTANLQYEWARVDSGNGSAQSVDGFRRARLGFRVKGDDQRWQLVVEHDFSGRTPADAFLELSPSNGEAIRIGQFKQPFSLEDALTDKQSAFLEPSPLGALVISRRIGVEYARWGPRGTFAAALFGQRLDGSNASPGASLRGTWRLHSEAQTSAHLGFSVASEFPRNARAGYSLNAGTVFSDLKTAATGSLAGVDRVDRFAAEALWLRGAWSAQVELAQVIVRRDLGTVHASAGSVQLTWSPTGDGRRYQRGVAAGPAPAGHVGWELALRAGFIDLDDGAVQGGQVQTWGLAATCYPHPRLRVIANLLHFRSRRAGVTDSPLTAGVRVQFSY